MLKPTPENMKASAERIDMLIDWMLDEQKNLPEKPKADDIQTIATIYGEFANELLEAKGMMEIAIQTMREREAMAEDIQTIIIEVLNEKKEDHNE